MPALPSAVGIDLGTTFSVIAHLDQNGQPQTLVNAEGEQLTASAVLIDGYDVIVGKEAVKALAGDAERVALFAKRDMGLRVFNRPLDGRLYPPEALQACVLHKLARDAARQIGPFRQAVITVPAYFDEVRRKATQDAGRMAGLEVLDIINEPTAAAVAYGCQQGFLRAENAGETKRVLVYDLGGGTFDVTIMQLHGARFTALATDGDVQLGGQDWDQRLVDHLAGQFAAKHGVDPREDALAAARLWRECEDAKRTLSTRGKTAIACEFGGAAERLEVAREEFQELTQDLLDRTRFTVKQAMLAAKLDWSDIDHMLLVGGSSRMPAVRQMLRDLSGKEPETAVSPDEAVAHGAALHAGAILAEHENRPPAFTIRNVNSHSLGIVATDRRTGRKRNATLIPRNTPLPAEVERVFKTQTPDQESVLVQIVEGENPAAEHCTAIGQCVVHGLPRNLPAGAPVAVSFRYETNGRLAISVRIADGPPTVQEITRDNGLSAEHLAAWREWVLAERE